MIRRVIPAAVLAAVAALSTLHNTSGAADEMATRVAATPVEVPGAIDATGGRDVTAELNRFLATIPADTTVAFPDQGRFRIEGVVVLSARRNVTLEGHDSTLFATTDGRGGSPPFYNYRAHWPRMREHLEIRDSDDITVHALTVEGPNHDGVYQPALEAQAGFVVTRSRHVILDRVTARATYGDGVYVVGGSADESPPSRA